jgi:hypothetical protein
MGADALFSQVHCFDTGVPDHAQGRPRSLVQPSPVAPHRTLEQNEPALPSLPNPSVSGTPASGDRRHELAPANLIALPPSPSPNLPVLASTPVPISDVPLPPDLLPPGRRTPPRISLLFHGCVSLGVVCVGHGGLSTGQDTDEGAEAGSLLPRAGPDPRRLRVPGAASSLGNPPRCIWFN